MSFEDELRAAMRLHDSEAPPASVLPPAPWRRQGHRRPAWVPVVAAACAVLAVAAGLLVSRLGSPDRTRSSPAGEVAPPPRCPARYELKAPHPWVPPTPGAVESGDRLVPRERPDAARICAYIGPKGAGLNPRRWPATVALTGGRRLTAGNLATLTDQLSWLPKYNGEERACATYLARSDDDAYLVGLRYRTGVLWVSVLGNHCAGAGNGVFETPANLVKQAQTAYRTGAWPKPVDAGPCAQGTGRLGQEHEMVAGQPDRVTICRMDHGPTHRTLDDPGPLVRALNNAATSEWNGQCRPSGKASANIQYDLIFQYRDGPPLAVTVLTSCHPAVFNGSLASEMSSTLSGLLRATLKTR